MATNAILVHHIASGFMNENHRRLHPEGKHRSMTHPVFCFEKILVENVVMWHVALVAIGVLPVRAVAPCSILRRDNVAIDAGFWIVG